MNENLIQIGTPAIKTPQNRYSVKEIATGNVVMNGQLEDANEYCFNSNLICNEDVFTVMPAQ